MNATRPFLTYSKQRGSKRQHKKHRHNNGNNHSFKFMRTGRCFPKTKTVFQKHNAKSNACRKANKPNPCVQIASSHAQNHTQRAAQKYQRAYHHEETQHKTRYGSRAAFWLEFLANKRHAKRAQHNANNFRTHILNRSCSVQLKRACCIAHKTRNAQRHIRRIAQRRQRNNNTRRKNAA